MGKDIAQQDVKSHDESSFDDGRPSHLPRDVTRLREEYAVEQRPYDPDNAAAIENHCGVHPSLAITLAGRGFAADEALERFLQPRLADLHSPETMLERDLVSEKLAWAAKNRKRVVIFGDYDVDGTTSATILADVLETFGAEVIVDTANRFDGGYGLSQRALERCLAHKPDVLVTCDCGSADHERVANAEAAGVLTLVIDHHLVPAQKLPATAFLNPQRPECAFPFKGLCSAGLAFSVAAGVRKKLGATLDVRPWLDLVAIGTVADVAPLEEDNRALTRYGLDLLRKRMVRPGVEALLRAARLRSGLNVSGTDISFRIAPRLNAPGRLASAELTVALLRAKTEEEAGRLIEEISALNEKRKAIEREVTEQAIAQAQDIYGEKPTSGIVLAHEDWHPGVVGITAARLTDHFRVPAVVIALDGAQGRGSARTIDGIDVHHALGACKSELLGFGGHAAAAGVDLSTSRLDAFRAEFSQHTDAQSLQRGLRALKVDAVLEPSVGLPTLADLNKLEPVGATNREPTFLLRDVGAQK